MIFEMTIQSEVSIMPPLSHCRLVIKRRRTLLEGYFGPLSHTFVRGLESYLDADFYAVFRMLVKAVSVSKAAQISLHNFQF